MIFNLIEIETSLINTNHPDFIGSADSLLNLFQEPDFIAKKPGQDINNGNASDTDIGEKDEQDPTFSLMTKPSTGQAKPEVDEEAKGDLKKSTITDYLPSIFGRRKNDEPAAEGAEAATKNAQFEESKLLKDSVS